MNDASVKVENAIPLNAAGHANAQNFDVTLFPMSGFFRGLAEQSAGRVKESCEKIKVASDEMSDHLREAYTCNAKGVADYGAKVIEISTANTQSALDFFTGLMTSKSVSEMMNLSAKQGSKNLAAVSTQNRELWELAQKVTTEASEPIRKGFAKVLPSTS